MRCQLDSYCQVSRRAFCGIVRRSGPDATQHRTQRQFEPRAFVVGGLQSRDTFLLVDLPRQLLRLPQRFRPQKTRIDAVRRQKRTRVTRAAVGLEAQQTDDKRVAGLRTFDIKRSRFRIGTPSALRTGCVLASRINRVGIHAISRLDPQRRWMRTRKSVVEDLRLEPMSF